MTQTGRPNILFVMTDQLRYDALGANGNSLIRTPNLDALAGQSANFSHCFVQAPVCVPSRQTFFTGRYPRSHRNRVNYTPLKADERLLQSYLQEAGYRTACIGKLHYYPPTRAFAESTGFHTVELHDAGPCDRYSDYVQWLKKRWSDDPDRYRRRRMDAANPFTAIIPDEHHETTWTGESTRETLKTLSRQDRPFFLFSSYWKPHSPFEVPEPFASMYNEVSIPVPNEDHDPLENVPEPVRMMMNRHPSHRQTNRAIREWVYRSYYGAISQIDREVGLTLKTLDELGLADNTIVIFTSDHGEQLFEHGMLGKNVFFEGSLRIPFMIRWPGKISPSRRDELIETTDVLSTLFELTDIPVPNSNQGQSFARLLSSRLGSEYLPRNYIFSENAIPEVITSGAMDYPFVPGKGIKGIRHPDAKCVRSRDWKYNYYVGSGEELYHLAKDPSETRNLAGDRQYEEKKLELKTALLDWLITADETDQFACRWGAV